MKHRLLQIAAGLLLLAAVAWLVSVTEWTDSETPTPARNEAATNDYYALQRLLRELGGAVVRRQSLDTLPPTSARLVLASRHWDLFPDRAVRLQEWVERGGHLIVSGALVNDASLKKWLPFARVGTLPPDRSKAPDSLEDAAEPNAGRSSASAGTRTQRRPCAPASEPDTVRASYEGERGYRFCSLPTSFHFVPPAGKSPLWSLQRDHGNEMLRMPLGQGSVTVVGSLPVFANAQLLAGDNALIAATALQAGAGTEHWFVFEEAREPFARWLWQQGSVAILLGALALAAALWRAAVRFGPLIATPGTQRRSMAEQLRGTAQFLQQHGGDALHAAQVRALHETAARQLRRGAQGTPAQRDAAIATATGIGVRTLGHAMRAAPRNPAVLAADLELIETARRRLDAHFSSIPP